MMNWIGWICFGFGLLRWVVSLINLLSRPYLSPNRKKEINRKISVLIPARNEEKRIGHLLDQLLYFSNPPFEILVYDDESTDKTAGIIKSYSDRNSSVRLIQGRKLPEGWQGKNHACFQLALQAKGELFLFLDADVGVEEGFLDKLDVYMDKNKLQLLSIFPRQIMPVLSTRLAIPLMNWILLSLLPLSFVRLIPFPSVSAANGQCICFEADFYKNLSPHQQVKSDPVEDIAIMKLAKKSKGRVATLLGDRDVSCYMYDNLPEAIDGFSKNIFRFFGGSKILTLLFALVTSFTPVGLFIWNGITIGLFYLLMIFTMRIFISIASKQAVGQNLFLMIPQQFIFLYIIWTAFRNGRKKEIIWKERNIYGVS